MALWLVVAVVVGLLIGRLIRVRDRQLPVEAPPAAERSARIPVQGSRPRPGGRPAPGEPGPPPP